MRISTTALLIACFISLNSCCEEPPVADSGGLPIRFIDATTGRKPIYDLTQPIFPRDSLKVKDLATNKYIPTNLLNNGDLIIDSIYEPNRDQSSFNSETCKSFIIQFFQYELDTISFCYKLKSTKCNGSEFSFIKASWNNKMIYSTEGGVYHPIVINK